MPAATQAGFQIARIGSGSGWPTALPELDRIAAVPPLQPGKDCPASEVILFAEMPTAGKVPVCTREGDEVRWSLDPLAWIAGILAERYVVRWRRPLPSFLPLFNYSRLPDTARHLAQFLQSPRICSIPGGFPSAPVDLLVEELRQLCCALSTGREPRRSPVWPDGRRAALTLTHDLDTAWILDPRRADLLREIVERETSLGFRGAWYVTGNRLDRDRHGPALELLLASGHEVAPHGWNHDAKLNYVSRERQVERMERIRTRFAGLPVEGFRAPWYARSPQLASVLAPCFEYDSSVPNSSGFFSRETGSGCCSVLPYHSGSGLLQLPLSLPPDMALDPATGGYAALLPAVEQIIAVGGVVVTTLHPPSHPSGKHELESYFAFLETLHAEWGSSLWSATPAEIVRRYRQVVSS